MGQKKPQKLCTGIFILLGSKLISYDTVNISNICLLQESFFHECHSIFSFKVGKFFFLALCSDLNFQSCALS